MTITFLDLYNKVTGQAWSLFDDEVESLEDFETAVTLAVQKALSAVWCSYNFPFREKTLSYKTAKNKNGYKTPNGNIIKKIINSKTVYCVKSDGEFLNYEPDYETLEEETGTPESFYIKGDTLYLYPVPDDVYKIEIDYWSIFAACDKSGTKKATLEDETDYIDIPEKYEHLFANTLLPLTMVYIIADESDENHSGYQRQYEDAYKILLDFTKGIETEKRMGWK